MFSTKPWCFEETRRRSTRRDPFEAEFFSGEGETEDSYGRTDALVREVLQNSLDASLRSGPVRVRFALSDAGHALGPEKSAAYLGGLVEHLDALKNDCVNTGRAVPAMSFLAIEDFGTRGLVGDPELTRDPEPDHAEDESFYWFWRNIGRSGKRGSARGRWGLGKTVFPSSSKINCLFGYTIRASDSRRMIMGQAITKIHKVGTREYEPEGFFCDPDARGEVQLPFTDPRVISRFVSDFGLSRKDETGLSVVVPYPLDFFRPEDVIRSVLVHFFVPIIKRELVVDVSGPGIDDTRINADTIRTVAAGLTWNGSLTDKKHAPPPLDFAEWAIRQQREMAMRFLNVAGDTTAPQWSENLFPPGMLDELRREFRDGQRLAIRVPVTIERKGGGRIGTYFDAFIEPVTDVTRGEDYFVREGMTISQISTLAGCRGVRGLVLVDHEILSTLLGDAEGPAHTKWGENESRPDEKYEKWKWRVRFVKNSLSKLVGHLSPPPDKLEIDLLHDVFSIEDPKKTGHGKTRGRSPKPGEEPPEPLVIPEIDAPRPFRVVPLEDPHGFRIRTGDTPAAIPIRLRVRVAYDVPDGNPFSGANYSPFDFVFDDGASTPVDVTHRGILFVNREDNRIEFDVLDQDFDLEVTGFDPLRDLIVDVREVKE